MGWHRGTTVSPGTLGGHVRAVGTCRAMESWVHWGDVGAMEKPWGTLKGTMKRHVRAMGTQMGHMRARYTERHTKGMLRGHLRALKTPRGTLRGTLRRYVRAVGTQRGHVRAMETLRGTTRVALRGRESWVH